MNSDKEKKRARIRKLGFYVSSFAGYAVPNVFYRARLAKAMDGLSETDIETLRRRTDYYIRCTPRSGRLPSTRIADFRFPFGQKHKHSTYFFDLYRTVRQFDSRLRFDYLFGDITDEPSVPTLVKSRPITDGPTNAVLLRLNSLRHFRFIDDTTPFREKKDMLVSRNIVRQPQRMLFLQTHFGNPRCDVGKINNDFGHPEWLKEYMSIEEQLRYKFVACIEGNDVATNLKWVMSSNSLAVMPRPKYETWFMEGTLRPGVHYVEVRPDYTDLNEKMDFYISHPDEAERIIANAHAYIEGFRNDRLEQAIQTAVLGEYFTRTGQKEENKIWERTKPY